MPTWNDLLYSEEQKYKFNLEEIIFHIMYDPWPIVPSFGVK